MLQILQIAQIGASIAIILLAAFLIPLAFHLYQQVNAIGDAMRHLGRLIGKIERESADLIRASARIAGQAELRMEDVKAIAASVRHWASSVDRTVDEVSAVLDPRLLSAAREARIWGAGVGAFAKIFARTEANHGNGKDHDHVRRQ